MLKLVFTIKIILVNLILLQAEYPYCFRFTWIGPFQDKNNIADITCDSIREDLTNIPCRQPLVATDNDNIPDTVDLWSKYKDKPNAIGCPMYKGLTCVKYTYTYNKGVQNITYMCGKVNTTTAGCYRQKYISGLDVEVCVCDSQVGAMPCNTVNAQLEHKLSLLLIALITITIFYKLFKI
ncbi:uncharacterized protein LOC135961840 [Calliphora vicina]|uniref:uncharacterized protein LOC135961840 n=1 Tax=Calliphora vicina TaxID=7373 RepID=UPI00325AFC7C